MIIIFGIGADQDDHGLYDGEDAIKILYFVSFHYIPGFIFWSSRSLWPVFLHCRYLDADRDQT